MHVLYVAIARTAIHSRPSAEREMSAARRRNQERPATLKHHRRLAVGRRLIASAALRQSNPLNSRSSFLLLLFLHSCILSSSILGLVPPALHDGTTINLLHPALPFVSLSTFALSSSTSSSYQSSTFMAIR
jgi:hypothetical protein